MRGILYGLLIAGLLYVVTGGHFFFLPLFLFLPLSGFLTHRRIRRP